MNIRDIPVRVIGPGSQPTGSDGDAITYMDIAPNQLVSVAASLIPFLEKRRTNSPGARVNLSKV